ncbi:MFS transporter [Loigolactobacillus coryniformis]|uniref:MFS transporter n=1 Tax=Loigolactobacillus coryniformis subsp. torquens DSM 20004 = KCTC 3535 TaxID=1423822 RepID=A0A2D1KRS9_9LACO|nr:MFS transporter [Loigolactobacillus coryniformis]ATO44845.1 MFS transporter [Loigolactobacillus coryniformis subsp. torquens DSM 20004 = KCTC 3535]KRK79873.1 major facilitator superfamily protein [Loigolactobacillus coryniformis subsp. torquens DSM 20004 = KCTC 3535]
MPFKLNQNTNWRLNFYLIFSGQFMSGLTTMIVQYAFMWYITDVLKSATALSLSTLMMFLPWIFLAPVAGVVIDRWSKKAIMIGMDLLAALVAIIISVTIGQFAGGALLTLLLVAMLTRAITQVFQQPTLNTIVPAIVPEAQLTKANGQIQTLQSLTAIIAPGLSAVLFGIMPMQWIILLDVIGAVFGSLTVLLAYVPQTLPQAEDVSFFHNMRLGVRELMQHRGIFQYSVLSLIAIMFIMPGASLYPLMTTQHFGGTIGQAGIVETVWSVGSLLGGLFISIWGAGKNRFVAIFSSLVVMGATFSIFGLLPSNQRGFWIFAGLNIFAGFGLAFMNSPFMAIVQERIKPEMMGRVMSVLMALTNIGAPIGLMFAGPLADQFGIAQLFILAGVATLITAGVALLLPAVRQIDKK